VDLFVRVDLDLFVRVDLFDTCSSGSEGEVRRRILSMEREKVLARFHKHSADERSNTCSSGFGLAQVHRREGIHL